MRRTFFLFSISCFCLFACKDQQKAPEVQQPVVSKHSAAFNASVRSAMDQYYALTEAFVNWDSSLVLTRAGDLVHQLDGIKLNELDSTVRETASGSLSQAKGDLNGMLSPVNLTEKRHLLNSFTQNLYDLLRTVRYDESKLYLQLCPMAFNDEEPGVWLSNRDSIRNPYLGLHHPRYGKAMIDCGENKSTIDFTQTEK